MTLSPSDIYSQFGRINQRQQAFESRATGLKSSAANSEPGASGGGSNGDERLREVAEQFEALFLEQMVKSMRETQNPEQDMLHGGMAENYFEDMLYQEYAKLMAKRGSFGIADQIYDQFRSTS